MKAVCTFNRMHTGPISDGLCADCRAEGIVSVSRADIKPEPKKKRSYRTCFCGARNDVTNVEQGSDRECFNCGRFVFCAEYTYCNC